MPRVRLPASDFGSTDLSDLTLSYMEGTGCANESHCGCSSCKPSIKRMIESEEEKVARKKRVEKIHQDISKELVAISKKIDRAFPDRKGELMGFGADAAGAALSSGMSFLETPSWEGAGKLAEAGADAAKAADTSCKPDPIVTAMVGGALALLTGGIGGALATVLGAAGSMLPSIMGAAFGCPEGKRKMGEAIKKCMSAVDEQLLYGPLNIYPAELGEDYRRTYSSNTSSVSGPTAQSSLYYYGTPSDSASARMRISRFSEDVVSYISAGSSPEESVKNAIINNRWLDASNPQRTAEQSIEAAKSYAESSNSADPAGYIKEAVSNKTWQAEDKFMDQESPGWRGVVSVVKSCVENAVVKAAAAKAGVKVPPTPVPQVQVYRPESQSAGFNLLPLLIGGAVLTVALVAKNRGSGGES